MELSTHFVSLGYLIPGAVGMPFLRRPVSREDGFGPCHSAREDCFVPCSSTREDGFVPCSSTREGVARRGVAAAHLLVRPIVDPFEGLGSIYTIDSISEGH